MEANEISNNDMNLKNKIKDTRYNSSTIYLVPSLVETEVKKSKLKNSTKLIIFLSTLILFSMSIIILGVIKNEELKYFIDIIDSNNSIDENATESFNDQKSICDIVDFSNFSIISHPLSFLLVILYMFIFWRRSCCLKFFFGRPAPPMIIPPFKKFNRFYSSVIYGLIAFDVFDIISSAIYKNSASDTIGKLVNDPSGLFKLLIRLVEVFLAALRYYPPLIAFNSNSFIIYLTSSIYMLTDQATNIYVESILRYFLDFYLFLIPL